VRGSSRVRGYYFITDSKLSRAGNMSDVKNAVRAGVRIVQYRNKEADTKEMLKEALRLKSICSNKGVIFLINDRVDIALAVDADGVHLGTDDMSYMAARKLLGKKKIIGLTAHNIKEARTAQKSGADYIGASPVFLTDTKPDAGVPAGIELIKQIRGRVNMPIVAIGGINLDNAKEVIEAGSDALCAISAVVTKPDVKMEIERFQRLFKRDY